MPSILTHQYVAHLTITAFQKQLPFLKSQAPLVWLGAQGPDPFFFYGHAPFKKRLGRDSLNHFGSTLHNQAPHKSLWPLIQHGWFGPHADYTTRAYVIGALTHYVLDRTCHPYVFYRSGFDEHGSLTEHYSADHARLEVAMDAALIQKLNLSPAIYQPQKTLSVDAISLQTISQLYFSAFPKLVQEHSYQQAVEDMQATYRFLYHGRWLNRLLVILIAGKRSLPFSLIHPHKIKETVANQALNLTRKSWRHPITGTSSQLTVPQLIQISEQEIKELINLLIQEQLTETKLKQWCNQVDYDGKEVGKTMRFFQSYYSSYRGRPNHDQLPNQSKKKSV
jgi:hypothetical protein